MLSQNCEQKLLAWLGPDTWYKLNDNDMNRFYEFIDAYITDNGYRIDDEIALRDYIAIKAGVETNDILIDTIRERISLMYNILDFLKATHR